MIETLTSADANFFFKSYSEFYADSEYVALLVTTPLFKEI